MIHKDGHEQLSEQQIYSFLKSVDKEFPVALSEKTDLKEYSKKLYRNATICFEVKNNRVVAMVAGYTENTVHNIAFVSIVAVLPSQRGKGLAKELLKEFICEADQKRLTAVHLYAVRENIRAMKLYQGLGFVEWFLENEYRKKDVHFIYYLKQKTVLITAIGSFSTDIVIKNLKKIGFRTIGCDIYAREWIADAYNVSEFYQVPKVADKENYFSAICHICSEEAITHIIPSTDIEVDFFNEYRAQFEEKNICICISPAKTIEICRNKKKQQEFIDENMPEMHSIPTVNLNEVTNPPFSFPMICKPIDGRSSQGVRYINTFEDWLAVRKISDIKRYIVQPLIIGRVITVDVVRQKNGLRQVVIPRAELLRTLNGAGISVKVYPDDELEKIVKKIADMLGIIGCVNFEFIHAHDGIDYYVECNPRFSGGVEFSCLAGYDCVGNHVRAFENKEIDEFKLKRQYYIARKYEEYVTKIN